MNRIWRISYLTRLLHGTDAAHQTNVAGVTPDSRNTPPARSGAKNTGEIDYSSDQPIDTKEQDEFNRWPFAKRIGDTLASRNDPGSLVLGLYGAWGDGKTSTLRLMERSLAIYPNVVTVNFNPWFFESDEQLLRGFFATLATSIGKSLPTKKEELGQILDRYGSLLSLASISIGGVVQIGAADAARGLGKALSTVELDDLRARLNALLRGEGKRVVVFVDDIDRLDRNEIQSIFKLVKLSASFEHTSYVLAFDDEIVAAALGEKYGTGGSEAGRGFLEKIVQVPLHLPPPDEQALRKMTFSGVEAALSLSGISLSNGQAEAFARHFVDGLEPGLKTPRQSKLYANALMFALPLLKGEVNPVDQMLLEGIRILYPKLYFTIRDNPEIFLKGVERSGYDTNLKSKAAQIINSALEETKAADAERLRASLLEVLFPRLGSIFGNRQWGSDWDLRWDQEQRLCSERYFQRYFTYAIPPGDVSDIAVSALIETARKEPDKLENTLANLAGRRVITRTIEKLRRQEAKLDASSIPSLVLAIARNGGLLPRETGPFAADFTIMQAGILIAHLVARINPDDVREDLAQTVIGTAQPLPFAVECFRWLRVSDGDPESDRIVTAECEAELGKLIADRVRSEAMNEVPFKKYGADSVRLLWLWSKYGPTGETSAYLRARFEADSSELDDFLRVYVPLAWGLQSGLSHIADLSRNNYDAMAELIDPNFVILKLRERYGTEIDNPRFDHPDDTALAMRIAHQFAYIHKKISEENAGTNFVQPGSGGTPTSIESSNPV